VLDPVVVCVHRSAELTGGLSVGDVLGGRVGGTGGELGRGGGGARIGKYGGSGAGGDEGLGGASQEGKCEESEFHRRIVGTTTLNYLFCNERMVRLCRLSTALDQMNKKKRWLGAIDGSVIPGICWRKQREEGGDGEAPALLLCWLFCCAFSYCSIACFAFFPGTARFSQEADITPCFPSVSARSVRNKIDRTRPRKKGFYLQ